MKSKHSRVYAIRQAECFLNIIEPACHRAVIAGSLRRGKEEVGDIEIVCIPKFDTVIDMFGNQHIGGSLLDYVLSPYTLEKNGEKFKQLTWGDITIDLFVQPDPQTWGVNFTIRTGSADFTHWLVTDKHHWGACPSHLRFSNARIWSGDTCLNTPEEEDVFHALGLDWIPPHERERGRW